MQQASQYMVFSTVEETMLLKFTLKVRTLNTGWILLFLALRSNSLWTLRSGACRSTLVEDLAHEASSTVFGDNGLWQWLESRTFSCKIHSLHFAATMETLYFEVQTSWPLVLVNKICNSIFGRKFSYIFLWFFIYFFKITCINLANQILKGRLQILQIVFPDKIPSCFKWALRL